MAWDINQVTIIGRLTRDPELRYGQSGTAFCTLSIAVNSKSFKEGTEEEVSYFDVATFGKTAEISGQYLSKGKRIGVQGSLRQQRWEDQSGQKKYKVDIVAERIQFLTPQSGSGYSAPHKPETQANTPAAATAQEFDETFPVDDEIPF